MAIVDAHYHLEPRMESIERLVSQMDRWKIDRVALIASPVDPFHLSPTAELVAGLMRKALGGGAAPIGRLVYRSTVTRTGFFSVLGKKYPIYPAPDNDAVQRALDQHPDKFYGWFFVNPRVSINLDEVEARMARPGWVGIKCHPFWHRFATRDLADIASWCQSKDKPLLVHLGGDRDRGDYKFLTQNFPRLRVLFAHAGVPWYRELWAHIRMLDNAFIDLSSTYLDEYLRNEALKFLRPSQCLYGSDGPYGSVDTDGGYDHGSILSEVKRMRLSTTDIEGILGRNFSTVIGSTSS